MNIADATVYDIAERIGEEADRSDGEIMLAILSRECVTDTEDVTEAQWLKWINEAAKIRRGEDSEQWNDGTKHLNK